MRKAIYIFILLLCVLAVPAYAITSVPGDLNGDKIVSEEELKAAEKSMQEGQITSEELAKVKHIHEQYPRSIADTRGRTVTIYQPLQRVVCTISHHMETMRSLKVPKDVVVGAPENIDIYSFFPEFKDLPTVGSFYEPNVEKIIELNPDIVLVHPGSGTGMFGSYITPLLDKLDAAGITVACLACSRPEIYPEEIKKMGILFEKENEAHSFIDFYQGVIDSVKKKTDAIHEEDRPLVYSENRPYMASENDVPPIEMAGGHSFFAGVGEVNEVDKESVITANPQFIIRIMGDEDYDRKNADDTAKMEKARNEILARPELQNTTAVKEKRVYLIASPLWTYMPFSGCRHFIGVAYLAKWFHPDLFQDLDPKAMHQRYITEFQGLDYDLNKKGVLVYPASP